MIKGGKVTLPFQKPRRLKIMKKYKISLISILCAFIVTLLAIAICLSTPFAQFVYADDTDTSTTTTTSTGRPVTLSSTSVFYAAVNSAEIVPTKKSVTEDGVTSDRYFTKFEIGEGETVTFRKNLAYSWYTNEGVKGTLSMSVGFEDYSFESYTIKFQSQQYNKTKDTVTSNYLTFFPVKDDSGALTEIKVAMTSSDDFSSSDATYTISGANAGDRIDIEFKDFVSGNFDVYMNGVKTGLKLANVKESCAKYVSSGTSAATPLTFSAKFADGVEDGTVANMIMYQLNGQSFELYSVTDSDGTLSGGSWYDTEAPVLCLNTNISYVTLGSSLSFDYTAIDVITSSPKVTVYFYVLSDSMYNTSDADFDYERITSVEGVEDIFKEVSSDSSISISRDEDTFVPVQYLSDSEGIIEVDGSKVYGLVKVYFELVDITGDRSNTQNIFLDRYMNSDELVNIYGADLKNVSGKTCNFIKVVEDTQGSSYVSSSVNDGKVATSLDDYKKIISYIEESYQAKIDEVIAELDDGVIYAGSSNSLYLPDFSGYAVDNYGGYTELKYSIYYKNTTTGSSTSLSSNQLSLTISANETYRFTIYVTDVAGNSMRYPTGVDDNGDVIYETLETSDIWDDDFADLFPFFTVEPSYKAATAEDPGEQSVAYVDSTYSASSFTINGISGSYSSEYSLYVFDRDQLYADTDGKVSLSYEEFVENVEALFNKTYTKDSYGNYLNTRKYFKKIKALVDLQESDADYDDIAAYEWSSSSLSFVPQSADVYYVIKLDLTDTGLTNQVTTKYMAIRASAASTALAGEDDWLANNYISVVLFCVAGLCFIALIIVICIKPKEEDVDSIVVDENGKIQSDKKSKKNAKKASKKN